MRRQVQAAAVAVCAAMVVAGCGRGGADQPVDGDVEDTTMVGEVEASGEVRRTINLRGGPAPDGALEVVALQIPVDAKLLTLERGRWVGLYQAGDDRWVFAADDPISGRILYETALPAWVEEQPTLVFGDERAYLYTDRPNPEVDGTAGGFAPAEVPSRVQQVDAYDLTSGAHLWTAGPLSVDRHPEQVPNRIVHLGDRIVAGDWALTPDGEVAWHDPDLADLLDHSDSRRVGGRLVHASRDTIAVWDLNGGRHVADVEQGGRIVAATARHVLVQDRDGWRMFDVDAAAFVGHVDVAAAGLGRTATVDQAITKDDGSLLIAADTRGSGPVPLLHVDADGDVLAVEQLPSDSKLTVSGGWLLALHQPSQSETRLAAFGADGTRFEFQVTYGYGQAGTPDVTAGVDGYLYLSAGDRLFAIDSDGPTLRFDVGLGTVIGQIEHVDGGTIVFIDRDGRLYGIL